MGIMITYLGYNNGIIILRIMLQKHGCALYMAKYSNQIKKKPYLIRAGPNPT